MIGIAAHSHERAVEQVEDMLGEGTPFAQVEDVSDAAAPHEQKAGLWPFAWSLRESRRLGSVGNIHFRAP